MLVRAISFPVSVLLVVTFLAACSDTDETTSPTSQTAPGSAAVDVTVATIDLDGTEADYQPPSSVQTVAVPAGYPNLVPLSATEVLSFGWESIDEGRGGTELRSRRVSTIDGEVTDTPLPEWQGTPETFSLRYADGVVFLAAVLCSPSETDCADQHLEFWAMQQPADGWQLLGRYRPEEVGARGWDPEKPVPAVDGYEEEQFYVRFYDQGDDAEPIVIAVDVTNGVIDADAELPPAAEPRVQRDTPCTLESGTEARINPDGSQTLQIRSDTAEEWVTHNDLVTGANIACTGSSFWGVFGGKWSEVGEDGSILWSTPAPGLGTWTSLTAHVEILGSDTNHPTLVAVLERSADTTIPAGREVVVIPANGQATVTSLASGPMQLVATQLPGGPVVVGDYSNTEPSQLVVFR